MIAIAREYRACTDAPMLIQSNAGLPQLVDGEVVYSETPEFMASQAVELAERLAKLVAFEPGADFVFEITGRVEQVDAVLGKIVENNDLWHISLPF